MKKMLYILSLIFFPLFAMADSVEIILDPATPVVNEVFKIHFKVKTEKGNDPLIQFNPRGIEILSREQTGVTTRTTYINGSLTVEREINVVYEAIAARTGIAYLDGIETHIDGKVIKSRNQQINVGNAAQRPADIFVEVELPKEQFFVNESILARYYLYHRIPISSTDVKKFPDLDKFMKRYHQEPTTAERVNYKGEIYSRRIIYTAQLFASAPGKYRLDPMSLDVAYGAGGNMGFGFGYGQMRSKAIRSKQLDIDILPLPSENVPKSFTGLIGEHKFSLRINKNQFMANEPIEIELKVSGPGALELLEAPQILSHASIEQFEVTSDLITKSDFSAEKTFSYTFLGREELQLTNINIPLSYYDLSSQSYKTENLKLGDLKIVGTSQMAPQYNDRPDPSKPSQDESPVLKTSPKENVLMPLYTLKNTYVVNAKIIFLVLLSIVICIAVYLAPSLIRKLKKEKSGLMIYDRNLNFQEFNELLLTVFNSGDYIKSIEQTDLKEADKKFLKELIKRNSQAYLEKKEKLKIRLPKKLLNNLEELINAKKA